VVRPRVLLYSGILLAIVLAMAISLVLRTPFKVDVVRDRGSLARIVAGGKIENVYRLQIMNATESAQKYRVDVSGLDGVQLASENEFTVDATQSRWIAVRVQLPYEGAVPGSHPIRFDISAPEHGQHVLEKSVFLVPR
jgi:polyferredoxin